MIAEIHARSKSLRNGSASTTAIHNCQLAYVVMRAYHASERQVAPNTTQFLSVLTTRYDIDTKTGHAISRAEMMRMLKTLLAERFKLAMHRETREANGNALLVDKDGPKQQEHSGGGPECVVSSAQKDGFQAIEYRNCTIGQFAEESLTGFTGALVADQTGLERQYDFEFVASWESPANPREGRREATVHNPSAPSIAGALRQGLGLRLQAQKIAYEFWTIDRVEKATEN